MFNVSGIDAGQEVVVTLKFNVYDAKTYLYINGNAEGEFIYPQENLSEINSMSFLLIQNQAPNTHTYSIIDDLEINLNIEEEEEEVNPLINEFAPVFVHHHRELFLPQGIEPMLYYGDLEAGIVQTLIKEGPLNVSDIEYNGNRSYALNQRNVDMYNPLDHPHSNDYLDYEPKVYARMTIDENDYTYLQYFLIYPFQDFFYTDHEGDWELVEVTLNDMGVIEDVTYYFNGLFQEMYYDIDLIDIIGSHVVAYVGEGSHNMYGSAGTGYPASLLDELDLDERYWAELTWGFKGLDKLNKTGPKLVPKGSGIEGTEYVIEQIDENTGWINYQCRWGENHMVAYKKGERGPKYNTRYELAWSTPSSLTYGLEMPFLGVMLFSPLDIYLFDQEGTPIDLVFYTGPEASPESAIALNISSYILKLNATDSGTFNVSVYYYTGEEGIILHYHGILNTETTLAEMHIEEGSDFRLCLDYDQEGEFEKCYYPNSYFTTKEYDYEIPDSDEDGITDQSDNCIDLQNPEQEDFNENGLGDACDNPRFYKEKALNTATSRVSKKNIKRSLRNFYWKNNFEIRKPIVFLLELVAAKKSGLDVQELLCEADKILVEYQMSLIDSDEFDSIRDTKRYIIAEKYFERGVELQEKGEYVRAIRLYMRAWISIAH